jgi:pyruvate dehydrogenase E2 component (dihydrolipoamide acetyltransferase)
MRFEFKLPDIGEGVTEGEVVSWLIKPGDQVTEDQDMVEVMTDKATVTIGAPKAGKVVELGAKEGDTIPVGDVLAVFEVDEGRARDAGSEQQAADAQREQVPQAPERRVAQQEGREPTNGREEGPAASAVGDIKDVLPGMQLAQAARAAQAAGPAPSVRHFNEKPLAAPATRKLARELGLDLRGVEPTGPGGRVTREDVERASGAAAPTLEARAPQAPAPQEPETPPSEAGGRRGGTERPLAAESRAAERAPLPPVAERALDERVPIRGVRKRIFENMARSKHTAAHFTYVEECDATELKALRERSKAYAERAGVRLTFLPFIVKAVVIALKKHPTLNCLVDEQRQEMVLRKTYDIGIAAATEAGLIVPVLRGTDRLSVLEIAAEIERLGNEAREGRVRKEDLGGSSFTITSLGKLGGLFATPIINYPEVAILGVHEMKRRPVVRGDEIVVGDVMLMSLSFDHRIIDGHVGAAFAQEVIAYLQEPDRLLVEMS